MPQNYRRRQKTTPAALSCLAEREKVSCGWNCSFIRMKFEFHTVETVVSYG